jgi:hemolysin D
MPSLPLPVRRQRDDHILAPISAFESETQAVIHRTTPLSEHMILHVIAAMIVLAVVLMAVVKLDRVVTAAGQIVPTQGQIFVQPFDRAIVRQILVRVGDVVHKDQVLATLDSTFAAADVTQYRQKMASDVALVARLEAERDGKPYKPSGTDPASQLQESIWRQRQSEYKQSVASFDAQIGSTAAKAKLAKEDAENYGKRLSYAAKIETMATTLEAHGYGSKLKTAEASDNRVEMGRYMAESQNTYKSSMHDLESLKAQREVYIQHWQDDVGTQLAAARDDLNQTRDALVKAERLLEVVKLQAPEDAVVLQIGAASTGSVVDPILASSSASTSASTPSPAPALFTLVPLGGPLEAEVEIGSDDMGFVRPGDHVEIKFDAYPFIRHGTAKGVVKTISEGSFTQSFTGMQTAPFFKARIQVTETPLVNVPTSFRLVPGMTLASDILVGKRTILSYLVEGALRTGSEAMREP